LQNNRIATTIIDVLALGLGLEPAYFEPFAKNGLGTLRFIHYPPTPMTSTKERGIGAHRDFGCITVLMQDEVGGLQVQNMATGEWIDVSVFVLIISLLCHYATVTLRGWSWGLNV
jgi:isopenicillin N synthase-like dioxygenase